MDYNGIDAYLAAEGNGVVKGPVAIIFVEDDVEVESTIEHHLELGFKKMLVLGRAIPEIDDDILTEVTTIYHDVFTKNAVSNAINKLMPHLNGAWVFTCFNAEYLYFPFSEMRNFAELVAFHTEERRASMLAYVIDVYAGDLGAAVNGVDRDDAYLDKAGYYALARLDPATKHPRERQLDFFGGLKWRYEEFVPNDRRKIDRIAIFRAKPDLEMAENFTFSDQEYNTYSCPWHNNITAAIVSFRTAKSLMRNPESRAKINDFRWFNSSRFSWTSQQLMDFGLIEPGQWF